MIWLIKRTGLRFLREGIWIAGNRNLPRVRRGLERAYNRLLASMVTNRVRTP